MGKYWAGWSVMMADWKWWFLLGFQVEEMGVNGAPSAVKRRRKRVEKAYMGRREECL